jgi:hypothetical protein
LWLFVIRTGSMAEQLVAKAVLGNMNPMGV